MLEKKYLKLSSVDSTNSYMKRNLERFESGTIVVADQQTKGRGRHGNSWMSPLGNLYCSFLLKGSRNRDSLFPLLMQTSLAVKNTLAEMEVKAYVKYPNDIMVNHRKISGILLESIGYETADAVIIGFGINIQNIGSESLSDKATSILKETKRNYTTIEVLDCFVRQFNLLENETDLFPLYRSVVRFEHDSMEYKGKSYKILDILPNGSLVLDGGETPVYIDYNQASSTSHYQ